MTSADLHALSRPDNLIFSPWSRIRGCVTWRYVCSRHRGVNGVFEPFRHKREEKRRENKGKEVCAHTWDTCTHVCVYEREKEREYMYVRYWLHRWERWTRIALAEREKANRLHYANAVQLQLTVAKNRCRYRGMLSWTPRGFLHSSFSFFLALVRILSILSDALRLFHDSGYIPVEWNDENIDRIAISLFVLYTLLYILLYNLSLSLSLVLFLLSVFLCPSLCLCFTTIFFFFRT